MPSQTTTTQAPHSSASSIENNQDDLRSSFQRDRLSSFRVSMDSSKYGNLGDSSASMDPLDQLPDNGGDDLRSSFQSDRLTSFRVTMNESKYGKLGVSGRKLTSPTTVTKGEEQPTTRAL